MSSNRKGTLFCLGCISFIPGLKNQLVNTMSFHPPSIKGYKYYKGNCPVVLYDYQKNKYVTMNEMLRNLVNIDPGRRQIKVRFLKIDYTDVLYYINPLANSTIIYSHSNATDIGYLFGHLLDLSYRAGVNIISYEYNGYGQSKHKASEESMYETIEKVVKFSIQNLNISSNSIILYGQSIGSAPTIHFASFHSNLNIGGIIIHSGIKSAVSVICNSNSESALPWYDAFKNLDKIKNVKCPVFVIHGTHDTVIPCNHGEMLYKLAPNKYTPWFVNGANHCNIELNWRKELIVKIRGFLSYIFPKQRKYTCEDISISRVSTLSSQSFDKLSIGDQNNDCDDSDSYQIETSSYTDCSDN